jgi:NAD(P)H-dependent FMN reductase
MGDTVHILLVSGSLRSGSVNTALLRMAPSVSPPDVEVVIYPGLGTLPLFNPDDDVEPLPTAVAQLRGCYADVDAVVYATPEYAGAMPGPFKNLLDWTVGSDTFGYPVAWINASTAPMQAVDAHTSLRIVLERTGADIVEGAVARIPVPRDVIGPDGRITDPEIGTQLGRVLEIMAQHVREARRSVQPTTISTSIGIQLAGSDPVTSE